MELKQIPIEKVLASFTQPREHFDKEKIEELASSILSNGLINPISVREYKGGRYMIVAGERRWRACKIAGIKKIDAFIKTYKNDFKWMVESLAENWQREDLSSTERENYVNNCWITGIKFKEIETYKELAKEIGTSEYNISNLIRVREIRKKEAIPGNVPTRTIRDVGALETEDRKKVLKQVGEGKINSDKVVDYARIIKKSTPEVKKALLNEEISVEQAQDLGKINSPKAREQALKEVKQHRKIADIVPKQMKNASPELSEAVKNKFNSAQRVIFTNLHEARVALIKADKNLKQANLMLTQLMQKQFEYGLTDKVLSITTAQMKQIADCISNFNIQVERYDKLKDLFIDRVENKIEK